MIRTIFTAEQSDVTAWRKFAKRQGMTLSAWIRRTLNNSIGRMPTIDPAVRYDGRVLPEDRPRKRAG